MGNVTTPTLELEQALWAQGYRRVAGIDEAGRGALAGPVVAAAVIVPPGSALAGVWACVRDSKQLSPATRAVLAPEIRAQALAWGVGCVAAQEIDRIGIAAAARRAMAAAVRALQPGADYLLIDWVRLAEIDLPQQSLVKADVTVASVAAASILAKVYRDGLMAACGAAHPAYAFAANKGYGTAEHLAALEKWGPCAEHRRSFAPIARPATLFE
jgi:ribonuclease HII